MVLGMADPIQDWITQPDVRRVHIDLGLESASAIWKFTRLHST